MFTSSRDVLHGCERRLLEGERPGRLRDDEWPSITRMRVRFSVMVIG